MRWVLLLTVLFAGCHSAGPYGYSKTYEPLADEERATARAREYDPIMAQREPEAWRKTPVALFGVVTTRGAGPSGSAYLTLSVRRREQRNLCINGNDEDTCRVTVTDADFGIVHALVPLRPEDDFGEHSVGAGSLVRVVGLFGQDNDPNDGAPVVRANYYRHWPRNFYVTRASAPNMRQ
jgi:hypothetical protein